MVTGVSPHRASAAVTKAMAEIRTVNPSDYGAIAEFLDKFLGLSYSPSSWLRRMNHWWDANPAFSLQLERGWWLEHEGRVVGFLGVIPRLVDTPDGIGISSNTTTWWVLPEHRKLSLGLFTRSLSQPAVAFINTTPADSVVTVLKRLKFDPFPGETERRNESLLIIDHRRVVAEALSRHSPRITRFAVSGAAAFLAPMARIGLGGGRNIHQGNGTLTSKVLAKADEQFDRLWESRPTKGTFTAVRTSEVVNWSVSGNPNFARTLIGCWHAGTLVGFAVLNRRVHPGLTILECSDIYFAEEDSHVVTSLVAAAGDYARSIRADLVVFRHFNKFLADTFRSIGLVRRRTPGGREYVRLATTSRYELGIRNSYFTECHGDRYI